MPTTQFREVFGLERVVEIDGEMSTLLVQVTFNFRNGQFRITHAVTTKQVSRNPDVNAATCAQLSSMTAEAIVAAQKMRDEWLSNNGQDDGPELFDENPEADGGPDDEAGDGELAAGFSASRRRK